MKFKRYIVIIIALIIVCTYNKVTFATKIQNQNSEIRILIDPGHGGIDGGAVTKNGTVEKDINLAISLKLKEQLEAKGYKVCMTRDADIGLYEKGNTVKHKKREDLAKRVELKSTTNCNAFISIHQNMFPQAKYKGAQVWYSSNDESKRLAEGIQESLKNNLDKSNHRLCKPAGEQYKILREGHQCSSVIVECGFLSNAEDEANLKKEEYQAKIAESIVYGIEGYFKQN